MGWKKNLDFPNRKRFANKLASLCLPLEFNVFIDDERDSNSDQCKVPAGHEHDGDTADGPEDGEGPW